MAVTRFAWREACIIDGFSAPPARRHFIARGFLHYCRGDGARHISAYHLSPGLRATPGFEPPQQARAYHAEAFSPNTRCQSLRSPFRCKGLYQCSQGRLRFLFRRFMARRLAFADAVFKHIGKTSNVCWASFCYSRVAAHHDTDFSRRAARANGYHSQNKTHARRQPLPARVSGWARMRRDKRFRRRLMHATAGDGYRSLLVDEH